MEISGEGDLVSGTIRITSASQGYDSGTQDLTFGSIFYNWYTTGLNAASYYVVTIFLTDASGQTTTDSSLEISLTPNPPVINKLVKDVDVISGAIAQRIDYDEFGMIAYDNDGLISRATYRLQVLHY